MLCMALKPLFAATFPASTGIETLNKKRIVVVLLSRAFYMDGSAIATSFHGKMASGGSNDRADSSTVRAHGLGRYGTLESGCHTRRRFCRRRNAVLASAFSAIIVYAYDLAPGKIGMISGLKFPDIVGANTWGPGPFEPRHALDLTWYAIHPIEM